MPLNYQHEYNPFDVETMFLQFERHYRSHEDKFPSWLEAILHWRCLCHFVKLTKSFVPEGTDWSQLAQS